MPGRWVSCKANSAIVQWFSQPERQKDYLTTSAVANATRKIAEGVWPIGAAIGRMLSSIADVLLQHAGKSFMFALLVLMGTRLLPISNLRTVGVMVACIALFCILFGIVLRRASPRYGLLLTIVLLSLLVKAVLILTAFQTISSPDERAVYHAEAIDVLGKIQNGFPYREALNPSPYSNLLALAYAIGGADMAIGKLLNAMLLAITGTLIYGIAARLFDHRTAIAAFLLVEFTPQLTIWGVQLLREGFAMLAISGALFCLTHFTDARQHPSWRMLCTLAVALLMLYLTRRHMAFVMLAVVAIATVGLLRNSTMRRRLIGVSLLLVIGIAFLAAQTQWDDPTLHIPSSQYFSLSTLQGARNWITRVQSMTYAADAQVSTVPEVLRLFPRATIAVLLVPYPKHITSTKWLMYYMVNVSEYLLLALAIMGVVVTIRHYLPEAYPLILFVGFTIAVYALADPSIGGMIRHRMQAWVILMVFVAKGLTHLSKGFRTWGTIPANARVSMR